MKFSKWILLPVGCIVLAGLGACSPEGDDPGPEEATVSISTPSVTLVTEGGANVVATVTTNTPSAILKKGFCYDTRSGPTISGSTVEMVSAGLSIDLTLSGLDPETTYFVRAFATVVGREPVYSREITFTTTAKGETSELDDYVPPAYPDNYTNIAGWSDRAKWNLANVHDPSVVLAEDGYYYMYQTDASYGNAHEAGGHFHGRRSKDLVNWEYMGGTMSALPDWVIPKLNEIRTEMGLDEVHPDPRNFGYWAPCVRKVRDGLYRMYYSIVCPGLIDGEGTWSERAFIGLAENTDPADNDGWVDRGYVVTNSSDRGLDFHVQANDWADCYYKWTAIDPSYIIDTDSKHWLVYGSWHSGIVALEIDAATGKPLDTLPDPWGTEEDIAPYGQLLVTRQIGNRWQGSEGPEIVYNPETGYYYLFVAYDAVGVPYNTRVCRSTNILGPYVGIDSRDLTRYGGEMFPVVTHPYKFAGSDGWVGISHCAIFDDGNGNWFYSSQGRLPENVPGINASNAVMMGHVRSILWTSTGWPVVMPERYGAVPKVPITEDELTGSWEHIDLSYSYGRQKTFSTMTLSADHKVTDGAWKGATWSYDAANQRIAFSNGVEVCLAREVDWEAAPRTHSIVYAGYTESKTYWGKKEK
uniref:Glycoside hydrolase family 43 protein n=1 Tax=termite gut metagenome TaxID=433724 RepID=S0DDY0_9ZZZZ